jgi:hypothetical protein
MRSRISVSACLARRPLPRLNLSELRRFTVEGRA